MLVLICCSVVAIQLSRCHADIAAVDLSSNAGIAWNFQPEGGQWGPINVPGGGWKPQGYVCNAGTYRARIPIPERGPHQRVLIESEAINFGAQVWFGLHESNLTKVADHIDGWLSVIADVTDLAPVKGPYILEVQVQGREKFKVNGKYTVPEGATWCPSIEEGILRGIHLRVVPSVRIDSIFARTSVASKCFSADVTVRNSESKSVKVSLSASIASWNGSRFRYPALPTSQTTIPAGSTTTLSIAPAQWKLGRASYWWPNVPYKPGYKAQLHLLNVRLSVGDQLVETTSARFGFREFAANGAHYYLNGIRCNLRGDNLQEANFGTDAYGIRPGFGRPSKDSPGWPKAVDNIERLNFNVMRIHQIPATPYMLDVCDERGLMLIEESPLRGSEGGEDFENGRINMLNMDRELVLRDRNHPATVIWSAANEWGAPIVDATATIRQVDPTRPVIGDGCGDHGKGTLFTEHYVNGLDALPTSGATPLADRPYGEGEAIWPADNTLQGFAWMATGTMQRRLKSNADIRNYTLNNAWPNFVPGEDPSNEIIEKKVKRMGVDTDILPAIDNPWNNPHILLMQAKYDPIAVCDVDFESTNALSDALGNWPVLLPRIRAGAVATRHIAVFNDEFANESITLSWTARSDKPNASPIATGKRVLQIPLGEFNVQDISFLVPAKANKVFLDIAAIKNGASHASRQNIAFRVVESSANLIPNGYYRIVNIASRTALTVRGDSKDPQAPVLGYKLSGAVGQCWCVNNLGSDQITLTNVNSGLSLEVYGEKMDKDASVDQWPLHGRANAIWCVQETGNGTFVLRNKNSGKALDLYGGRTDEGTRIVQWDPSEKQNQQWRFDLIQPKSTRAE